MKQLYYLYSYSIEDRTYNHPIAIVTRNNALQASLDHLNETEDWRVSVFNGDDKPVAEFTYDPLEIELTYLEYESEPSGQEYESCIYSLEAIDMRYIGDNNE